MSITEDIHLPTEEELTVQEINLSGSALKAGAFHLGKVCEFENNVRLTLPNQMSGYPYICFYRNLCYVKGS